MATNLELKVQLNNFKEVIKLLNFIKAEYKGILKQKDIYYKNPSGLLKLRVENKTYTLIRYLRDEKNTRWSNYELLDIKGKKVTETLESFLKVETVVDKARKLYMYDNTRIHLDTVKGLGYFLELETLVLKGKSDAQKRYNKIFSLLKLDQYPSIKKSYRDLTLKNK